MNPTDATDSTDTMNVTRDEKKYTAPPSKMITEKRNELIEIRPGRKIFTRHWILNDSASSSTSSSARTINFVCVHGTAASQEQYLLLWKAMDHLLVSTNQNLSLRIHCWAYDAIGCGHSPKLPNAKDYVDSEQVQDLKALVATYVGDAQHDTYFVGHSYGPTWIYKYLKLRSRPVAGLILISTGLKCKELVVGGPKIFRVLPLWMLNCMQPLLTASFLKIGFSPYTHKHNPELIAQSKQVNNKNDMETVVFYYKAHDWLSTISFPDSATTTTAPTIPAIVLHGMDDEIVPVHCGQQVCNQFVDTPLTVVPNASHMILLETPDVVAEHIVAFIQSPSSSNI
eukprot:scaffold12167_cov129-Cylindrotheca_fusiformis.AAC.1